MTKGLSLEQVAEIVEQKLTDRGICLTMGGEPTYLPHHPTGAEWNLDAMGPEKLDYARKMAARLLEAECPGALVLQIFGKWYPGEPLPRWNVLLVDHADEKLWTQPHRLLLEDRKGSNTASKATRIANKIAEKLDLKGRLIPALEEDSNTKKVAGWVLPLDHDGKSWKSVQWPWSKEKPIPLIEGDSPIGLRLPLDELPKRTGRKALTIECKNGALGIFIPPLKWKAFRKLVTLLETIAEENDLRDLIFCGYAPGGCPEEVRTYGLAADPGVLEVNLPPSNNWFEFQAGLSAADKAARKVGLVTTRLHLNGAENGTGGGFHLALGGTSVETNPFVTKPERISSLLRFWQHHPALSYAFSGQYVGPGCQAPRFDEGPTHSLYETEVACEGMASVQSDFDPARIDHFLKNLMTDAAGNTHRAELCFDKFFNTAAPNGCMGIIEFRAFETLPEARMNAVAALFLRSIVTRLFLKPFRKRLRRFGTTLHDEFFLPSRLWQDVEEICTDLQQTGLPFSSGWLKPIFDFRFPLRGKFEIPNGQIEVRQALESFPLMAEESQGRATVRKVDNSTDRLEIRLSDSACLEKGFLLINGIEVAFTEVNGSPVAGVRYKCASAHPALHPNVPIQSPLLFEWVDQKSGKTKTAARYHHWHPTQPVYDGFPKTDAEAAKRRKARWIPANELVGKVATRVTPRISPEYKVTLDLRRQKV
ncbi:MAG: transglutaminase family protein [Verrucomicrobiota bacterium]